MNTYGTRKDVEHVIKPFAIRGFGLYEKPLKGGYIAPDRISIIALFFDKLQ